MGSFRNRHTYSIYYSKIPRWIIDLGTANWSSWYGRLPCIVQTPTSRPELSPSFCFPSMNEVNHLRLELDFEPFNSLGRRDEASLPETSENKDYNTVHEKRKY